mgnify:CR=1 FL=1
MAEFLNDALGFAKGQGVTMLCDCSGDDHEGTFHTVPAGANGTIDSIVRYPSQGITFTVVIETTARDAEGDICYIVNSFDETDGKPNQFFK